jgi:hypothetical protein
MGEKGVSRYKSDKYVTVSDQVPVLMDIANYAR